MICKKSVDTPDLFIAYLVLGDTPMLILRGNRALICNQPGFDTCEGKASADCLFVPWVYRGMHTHTHTHTVTRYSDNPPELGHPIKPSELSKHFLPLRLLAKPTRIEQNSQSKNQLISIKRKSFMGSTGVFYCYQ